MIRLELEFHASNIEQVHSHIFYLVTEITKSSTTKFVIDYIDFEPIYVDRMDKPNAIKTFHVTGRVIIDA